MICSLYKRLSVLAALVVISASAVAHESRPLYIELEETLPQQYQLQWKTPLSIPYFNTPSVELPKDCTAQGQPAEFGSPDGVVRRLRYQCAKGLAGKAIDIAYPGPNPSVSSLVRYNTASGQRHIAVLSPETTSWTVPATETVSGVARQYALLGIGHIWAGIDHLLFVVCLLWVAGTWRRILITISGFTLAHSITLILSALQIVRLPVAPVEAAIALSIVFLATEIARGPRQSLTWRYPIAVSTSFGLLHGFGFAAALEEIGLPQTELATGLLFFNVGVEIGQVLFAAGVIAVMRLIERFVARSRAVNEGALRTVAGYLVGTLAVFWLIQRGAAF
ncbi:MAG TPA: HupE/UreJ family protein [Steroidobacter sp.]|uniref:HupE/UreJ family protein n=1 Tax=Steroidobacter sp. TaxID=1978227 RepID=UPI002ED93D28